MMSIYIYWLVIAVVIDVNFYTCSYNWYWIWNIWIKIYTSLAGSEKQMRKELNLIP